MIVWLDKTEKLSHLHPSWVTCYRERHMDMDSWVYSQLTVTAKNDHHSTNTYKWKHLTTYIANLLLSSVPVYLYLLWRQVWEWKPVFCATLYILHSWGHTAKQDIWSLWKQAARCSVDVSMCLMLSLKNRFVDLYMWQAKVAVDWMRQMKLFVTGTLGNKLTAVWSDKQGRYFGLNHCTYQL